MGRWFLPWTEHAVQRCTKVVTSEEDMIACWGILVHLRPNNLGLADALKRDLKKVPSLGSLPVTPIRKLETVDPGFLEKAGKRRRYLPGNGNF